MTGAEPLDGDLLVERTAAIRVEGNDSYGISVESDLDGDFTNLGTVSVLGNDTRAISVTGDVSGDAVIAGTVGATGENATGVAVDGDVGGALVLHSSVTTTGYRYTTPPPAKPTEGTVDDEDLYLEDLDDDDLLQGGPAVAVAGNVAGGVLLGKGPAYTDPAGAEGDDDDDGVKNGDEDDDGDGTKNSEDTDRDGDGIPDASETTPALTSIGGAPALLVGAGNRDITLGAVGDGDMAYGLVNQGTITGTGIYSGVESRALQIGVENGGAVNVEGGLRNEGNVSSTALDADATAVWIGGQASVPSVVNTGTLQRVGRSDEAATATGVLIGQDASVASMTNSGAINVGFTGNHGDAVGVRDLSGTLTEFTNSGAITAVISRPFGF